jgi:tripartite-type tricarboxylate transporter receptor subunit TctC
LAQAEPDGLTVGLIPVEAAITRELTLASPYTAAELSGRLVVFEEPWALVAGLGAPFDDLASLAAAAGRRPVVFGHSGLEHPTIPTLQVLALARDLGVELKTRRLPDLGLGSLKEGRPGEPVVDLLAWPLSEVRSRIGTELKLVAVLADAYGGPCAPAEKALAAQGRRAAARGWSALYEPVGSRSPSADQTLAAAAAVLTEDEARRIMDERCLAPSELGLEGSPPALAAEYEAQAALLRALGLAPGD